MTYPMTSGEQQCMYIPPKSKRHNIPSPQHERRKLHGNMNRAMSIQHNERILS